MSLTESGRLLRNLRKSKGFTQKQVADKLGVCAKTVSKWETGNGFPDVFTVSSLAEILGVSAETILSGSLNQNIIHTGNMARTKFYLCPHCGAIINTAGESSIYCCSKKLEPLKSREADESHSINTMFAPTPLARAKFCEESLKSAVKLGTEQYVILGCGYDTFSARNNNPGLKIFEIDKESTIKDKMKRLDRAGIKINNNTAIISADLSRENLKNVLERAGFDFGKKTFFSCLGLFYYMSKEDIEKLFKSISSFGAEGSTVVFDFADNHLFSSSVPRVKNMLAMAEQSGEKMVSCFSLEELEIMLGKYDFYIYEFLNSQDIQSRYFAENADGITAFEHIDYALAVLK